MCCWPCWRLGEMGVGRPQWPAGTCGICWSGLVVTPSDWALRMQTHLLWVARCLAAVVHCALCIVWYHCTLSHTSNVVSRDYGSGRARATSMVMVWVMEAVTMGPFAQMYIPCTTQAKFHSFPGTGFTVYKCHLTLSIKFSSFWIFEFTVQWHIKLIIKVW